MRQGWLQAAAWLLATGAATTLSWFGVHTVITGTAYDPPVAMPVARTDAAASGTPSGPPPESSATRRSPGSAAPEAPTAPGTPAASGDGAQAGEAESAAEEPGPGGPAEPSPSGASPAEGPPAEEAAAQESADGPGEVRSYTADGGRVVFELRADSASLVSATPHSGWQVQVWKQEKWVRVTFSRDDRSSSVFCTWHDGPPRVQTDER